METLLEPIIPLQARHNLGSLGIILTHVADLMESPIDGRRITRPSNGVAKPGAIRGYVDGMTDGSIVVGRESDIAVFLIPVNKGSSLGEVVKVGKRGTVGPIPYGRRVGEAVRVWNSGGRHCWLEEMSQEVLGKDKEQTGEVSTVYILQS